MRLEKIYIIKTSYINKTGLSEVVVENKKNKKCKINVNNYNVPKLYSLIWFLIESVVRQKSGEMSNGKFQILHVWPWPTPEQRVLY